MFPSSKLDQIVETAKSKFGERKPYDIQVGFVKDLIKSFNEGKIGFFESPTGTGKSMSVLTAALSYIQELNKDKRDYSSTVISGDIDAFYDKTNERSKLIICTRTHGQIKELVNEMKRKGMLTRRDSREKTRIVSLAARRHLCVNGEYVNLTSTELNNVCKKTCIYNKDKDKWRAFVKKINNDPMDIEDLGSYGRSNTTCPYFATRSAMQCSDVVLMPYQTLFQEQTREAMNIKLENSFIVIDEAHNLVDALNAMNTVCLEKEDLQTIVDALKSYQIRLSKSKVIDLDNDPTKEEAQDKKPPQMSKVAESKKLIMRELQIINRYIGNMSSTLSKKLPSVMEMIDFQIAAKLESENPIPMIDFAKEKSLIYRITKNDDDKKRLKVSTAFRKFFQFLEVSLNPDSFGRVLINESKSISYMLLNPSKVFEQVTAAKSIALVGGTLQPFDDLEAQLIGEDTSRIFIHVNDHVIPPENSLTFTVTSGPLGIPLNYAAQSRESVPSFNAIAQSMIQLSNVVPGGIIYFFTSFDYLRKVVKYLNESNAWDEIQKHKFILSEPSESSKLESVMKSFKSHIDHRDAVFTGAIMLAVMNGKLSEGINFQNDYCRCVVCVGLPFQNTHDRAVNVRMDFFDELSRSNRNKCSGQQFLENTCMRIVNQAIGRSFRNSRDYAIAILFDARYSQHGKLLPKWIQRNYKIESNWNIVMESAKAFFATKK